MADILNNISEYLPLFFNQALNKALKTVPLILAVMLLRLVMKRAPKKVRVWLWGVAALGLLLPVWHIPSSFSLILRAEPVPHSIVYADEPRVDLDIGPVDMAVNSVLMHFQTNFENSVTPLQIAEMIAALIWAAGIIVIALYAVISTVRLKLCLRGAAPDSRERHIRRSSAVSTPFILGVLFPRIYLPDALPETDFDAVLCHEKAHLKRRDPLWKLLGFLLLAYYWFDPLVWLGYAMLCRDIEFACDERVICKLTAPEKKDYAESLLRCSLPQHFRAKCPLAFGEVAVKDRIESVAAYRKPAWWKRAAVWVTVPVLAVCFLTDPVNASYVPEHSTFQKAILEYVPFPHSVHTFCDYVILDQAFEPFYDRRDISYHYAAVLIQDFTMENGEPVCQGEHFTTAYIAFKHDWLLWYTDLEQHQNTQTSVNKIQSKFPALDLNDESWRANYDALAESCLKQAKDYFAA